jgi:aminomethyltransferase
MVESVKKTALYKVHEKYGGKIINFSGFALPVQYEGIMEEHQAVRTAAGILDVSHMGEIEIKGPDAFDFIQNLVTNDINLLEDNQVLYTMMCSETGGVVDDLLVYKYAKDYYYLVVNASNIEKDYIWMLKNKKNYIVQIENISENISEIAIQGPKAEEILQKITETRLSDIKFFYCKRDLIIDGVTCMVSRTGYTGEDGFEIYMSNDKAEELWDKLMEMGKELGLMPAGLGARDTLRFEVALPLYGNELSEEINPLEAGLSHFVKLSKQNFIGKTALIKQKENGLKRKIVGFEMIERGVPRHGYEVMIKNETIGFVTTGYFSPTLKKNIGIALIDAKYSELDTEIFINIRNKKVMAKVISKKFYNKNYKKI